MRIGLGQFNASVRNIEGNINAMRRFYDQALELGVGL